MLLCYLYKSTLKSELKNGQKMAQKKSLQKKYVQKTTIKKQRLPPFHSIQFLILYLRTFAYSIMLMRQVQKHFLQIRFLHTLHLWKIGNAYSGENPISAGWIISDDVIVHKSSLSVMLPERKLFIRKQLDVIVSYTTMAKKICYLILTIITCFTMTYCFIIFIS